MQKNINIRGARVNNLKNIDISIPRDKIAVVSGLKDYIVVDTPDVLLICPRSEEQGIKKYIDDIRFEKGEEHS